MNKFVVGDKVYRGHFSREQSTVTEVLKLIYLDGGNWQYEKNLIACGEGYYREKDWDEGSRLKSTGEKFLYLLDGDTDPRDAESEDYLVGSQEGLTPVVVHETATHRWMRRGDFNYLEGVSS